MTRVADVNLINRYEYHTLMHVLGIDAGGTKTVCLLADHDGDVVAQARGGGANLQSAGELAVEKVLHQVMEEALGDRDILPTAICLGIAGVDRPEDADAVRGIMRRIGFKTPTLVVNDALVALTAGAGDDPGVVVVAGTGSIAYGRDAAGRAARAGGWGYLLGDEGGGFWIGRAALNAVVRQFDGRGPATILTDLVLEHMHLRSPTELIHEIYYRDLHRHAISGLAALVQRATDEGDAVSEQILTRAGAELTAAAASVIGRLEMRGEVFPTVLAGGIFRAIPWLTSDVTTRLSEVAPRADVRVLRVEPAVGAVRLAIAAARGEARVPTYV
jgi:N-acetylglucosamine kinase-like BadF-type ATPase